MYKCRRVNLSLAPVRRLGGGGAPLDLMSLLTPSLPPPTSSPSPLPPSFLPVPHPRMRPVSHLLAATAAFGLASAAFAPRQVQQQPLVIEATSLPPLPTQETYEGASVIRVQTENAIRMAELMAIAAVRLPFLAALYGSISSALHSARRPDPRRQPSELPADLCLYVASLAALQSRPLGARPRCLVVELDLRRRLHPEPDVAKPPAAAAQAGLRP